MKRHATKGGLQVLAALLICAVALGGTWQDADATTLPQTRVLVLHSYHEGLTWTDGLQLGIRDALKDRQDIELFVEYLDSKRTPLEDVSDLVADYLKRKYAATRFDAIIASDNNALTFLAEHQANMFPGIPMVFCGIDDFTPRMLETFGGMATGVVQPLDPRRTADLILTVQPRLRTLAVVSGANPTAIAMRNQVAAALVDWKSGVQIQWLAKLDTQTLRDRLSKLSSDDAVLLCNYNRDANGVYYTHEQSARVICAASPAPVYAMQDLYIGTGVVGGCMVSARDQGSAAARICLEILETGRIPETVSTCPHVVMFDHAALVRLGLDESLLPDSAVVVNKPISFYGRHKRLIWSAALAFALMIIALAGVTFGLMRTREAERKLRRNEENLRTTLDSIGDAVIATDTAGRVTRMNPVAERVTGWPLSEALGKPLAEVFDIVSALTREQAATPVERVLESGEIVGLANHTLLLSRDGTEYQIADSAAPIRDDDGALRGVVLVFRDVTEEYRTRQRLADSEERMALALMGANLATWDWDITAGKVTFDERAANMLGLAPDSVPTSIDEWRGLVHPDDLARIGALFGEHLRDQADSCEAEHRMKHGSGHWIWVLNRWRVVERDADGTPRRVCGTHLDITDRKQAEDALRESERTLATLMSNLPGMAYRCLNDEHWTMVFVSDGCHQVTGYQAHDLVNNYAVTYANLIHEDDRESVRVQIEDGLDQNSAFEVTYRIHAATGDVRWVWERGRGVFAESGKLLFLEGFIWDITKRRRTEEERDRLEFQLRQAQKMEAVGQLAGGVAHDFNNILTAIFGNVEMAIDGLESHFPAGHGLLESVRQIEKSAHRASSLTRQLLAFSRRQVIRPEVVDLNAMLRDLEKMLRRLITEDIELHLSYEADLSPIKADVGQLEQVVVNLVVNARDAMPEGGRLSLETRSVILDDTYVGTRPGAQVGPHVSLIVSDTGIGMDAATQERVFEPFFTTKSAGQGTGLGLSMVYGIVKQADGHVAVYSEPGRGTTFRVYWPCAKETISPRGRAELLDPLPTGTETIMICEDDTAVRELTEHMLRDSGYRVLAASNGADALRLAAAHSEQIDLLVTDVIMPGMNGRKLADTLTAQRPNMRTLYVSGYTSDVIAHHGVLEENVEFLEKPYSRLQMLRRVREVLGQPRPGARG
ncbi:MAG: PAS domain-containing protein [Phycisphaerae bacterium]|nr:PAS domain-containing protein [Phycisphaerae bacterium]